MDEEFLQEFIGKTHVGTAVENKAADGGLAQVSE